MSGWQVGEDLVMKGQAVEVVEGSPAVSLG